VKWHERLRHLDNVVFGPPVPDNRPLAQRLLRPRPAVWSPSGFVWYVVVVGMVAVLRWAADTAVGVGAFLALLVVAFLIMAADERKRARQHHNRNEG
jgi:hypothetical protein